MSTETQNSPNIASSRNPRKRHSFRAEIRAVIIARKLRGDPFDFRDIIKEAGGGSNKTVREELDKCPEITEGMRIGRGAKTDAERVTALEKAIDASLSRERELLAENQALKASLDSARADLDKLLTAHQDSQRLLLQSVDDLRQMVKAGQGAMPQGVVESERQKSAPPSESGDAILWKARHDRLLKRYVALDEKCRKLAGQLHELGVDVD